MPGTSHLLLQEGAMKRIEHLLARLPQPVKYPLKKIERPLKRIRNGLYSLTPRKRELAYKGHVLRYPHVSFFYQAAEKTYENILSVDEIPESYFLTTDPCLLEQILSHIGLSFVPDLFRLDDFETIRVGSSPLLHESKRFFENYYLKGLSEFRYRNALPVSRPIKLVSNAEPAAAQPPEFECKLSALSLNGGGKESIVMAEILKQMGIPFVWFTFGANRIKNHIENVVAASGMGERINVEWQLDPQIGRDAKYIGSIPLLGCLSFISLLVAHHRRCRYILVGNEYSSNFGNLVHKGFEINHQYDKSFEFEVAFGDYIEKNIIRGIKYISLVRPLYEILIAKLFSCFNQYFEHFISCNGNWRGATKDRWCKGCPKCAFVFLSLYPFLTDADIRLVFGEDLFHRKIIRKHIIDLCCAEIKPFECVGTQKESRLALYLSLKKSPILNFSEKPTRKDLEACCHGTDFGLIEKECLETFHVPHNMPDELFGNFRASVEKILASKNVA